MRKHLITLGSFATLLLTLVVALPQGARAGEPFTVILDWLVNPDHAALFVALEKGFFAERGLDVRLIPPADPNDPPKLVAAGRADLAVTYQPELYFQVDQGLPVTRVGTLIENPLNSLVVLEDSGITSIADLKGKTIGFSVSGFEDALLGTMLAKHGLSLDDVRLVNVNFNLSQALLSRRVDAVIGAFRNFELNQLAIEGMPGRAFPVEEEGVPHYDELILIANNKNTDDPLIGAFLDGLAEGARFLAADPDAGWRLFIKGRSELNDELNRRAWRDTMPFIARDPAALDTARYQALAEFMHNQGLIKAVPDIARYTRGAR